MTNRHGRRRRQKRHKRRAQVMRPWPHTVAKHSWPAAFMDVFVARYITP